MEESYKGLWINQRVNFLQHWSDERSDEIGNEG